MSDTELPLTKPDVRGIVLPRDPLREVAELLAVAIVRTRAKNAPTATVALSEVSLGFTADQSVNTNPSDTEGVRK